MRRCGTLLGVALSVAGCGIATQRLTVPLVNDTDRPVLVSPCSHFSAQACIAHGDRVRLDPGKKVSKLPRLHAEETYAVEGPEGQLLGCLAGRANADITRVAVSTISLGNCPDR